MGCLCSSSKKNEPLTYKGGKPLENDSVLMMATKLKKTRDVGHPGHKICQVVTRKIKTKADIDKMAESPHEDHRIIFGEPCARFDQITPHLYLTSVGGLTKENLESKNITMIINATYEWPLIQTDKITSYRVPIDDGENDDISIYFDEVADKIQECSQSDGNCVVHCMAGASRSTTLVLAYLIKHQNMPLKYAFLSVKKRREPAKPNLNFWKQLVAYELKIRKKASVEIKTETVGGIQVKYPDFIKDSNELRDYYEELVAKQIQLLKPRSAGSPPFKTKSQKSFNEIKLTYE